MQLFFIIFHIFFITSIQIAYSQDISPEKKNLDNVNIFLGDSLLATKKYQQALNIYETFAKNSQTESPTMLLKMAFLSEKTNDFAKALHYLHIYQKYSPSLELLDKMENLAQKYSLEGYQKSKYSFFNVFYTKSYKYLLIVTIVVVFLIFRWLIWSNWRKNTHLPSRFAIIFLFFVLIFILIINFYPAQKQVILAQDNTLVMSAPSAGGRVFAIRNKGNSYQLLSEQDNWVEIMFENKKSYIKKSQIF